MKHLMSTTTLLAVFAAALATVAFVDAADAQQGTCRDGSSPPCRPDGGGEEPEEGGTNNLSFPVILPEGVAGDGFPLVEGPWTFATITVPTTECTTGEPTGTVSPDVLCYYDSDEDQVWWLSQRQPENYWKTFHTVDPTLDSKTVVTAIDWGDLLESSPRLNLRRIRTEVTLFQNVPPDDPDYGEFVATFPQVYPFDVPCTRPADDSTSLGCFAALNMSDAVPGTEQSINEIQGTDFGVNTETEDGVLGHSSATETLIDPTDVRSDSVSGTGFHATVYSRCARLIIQRIGTGMVEWDSSNHEWGGDAGLPVVDIKAWQGDYTSEINASGTMIYGFNWNAQDEDAGTYRLTFVLDNGIEGVADSSGEHCNTTPNTTFTGDTLVANPGEVAEAEIIPEGDVRLNGDLHVAALSYLDITIKTRGGGGGGGGGRGGPGGPN